MTLRKRDKYEREREKQIMRNIKITKRRPRRDK